jgi:hypothetical protein
MILFQHKLAVAGQVSGALLVAGGPLLVTVTAWRGTSVVMLLQLAD